MDLSTFKSAVYGFIIGLTDILPVSARAHSSLLIKLLGSGEREGLLSLLIHLAVCTAIYSSCRKQIIKVSRAKALARIPKKRRKRPLDAKSLMDFSFWRTMIIPATLAMLFYRQLAGLESNLVVLAALMIVNGIILYIPQFFPSSNKDCRSLSRMEGLLMGFGGGVSVFPGLSGMGVSLSIGSICGVDRSYALIMTILMNLVINLILVIYDLLAIISGGLGTLSFLIILKYFFTAAAAFIGTWFGIRIMHTLSRSNSGWTIFSYYCWGVALFLFILNLMA